MKKPIPRGKPVMIHAHVDEEYIADDTGARPSYPDETESHDDPESHDDARAIAGPAINCQVNATLAGLAG